MICLQPQQQIIHTALLNKTFDLPLHHNIRTNQMQENR